jgi:hypothetical protein
MTRSRGMHLAAALGDGTDDHHQCTSHGPPVRRRRARPLGAVSPATAWSLMEGVTTCTAYPTSGTSASQ